MYCQVCVIGAGKMSRLLFKHMAAKGCTSAVLLNRSLPRAQAMAEEFPQVTTPAWCHARSVGPQSDASLHIQAVFGY